MSECDPEDGSDAGTISPSPFTIRPTPRAATNKIITACSTFSTNTYWSRSATSILICFYHIIPTSSGGSI